MGIGAGFRTGWTSLTVPKMEAATAIAGTLRSRPGKLDAFGLVWSREGKIQIFLKDYDVIHDVVVYCEWDIYVTLHGNIRDLSDTLLSVGVSDNDTTRVHCRLRGGSNNT